MNIKKIILENWKVLVSGGLIGAFLAVIVTLLPERTISTPYLAAYILVWLILIWITLVLIVFIGMKDKKVAIVGSRDITDCEHIIEEALKGIRVSMIISGEAEGVDTAAKEYAEKNKITYKPFPPDLKKYPYKTYGNYAYFKRNTEIVEFADIIVAIWDGHSGGTADVIQKAKENKKKLIIKKI